MAEITSTVPESGRLSGNRRLPELAAEQLRHLGVDAEAFERELASGRAESERRLADLRDAAVSQSDARAQALGRLVDDFAAPFDGLTVSPGDTSTHYEALDGPLQIWSTGGISIDSAAIAPYNSRAKVRMEASFYPGFWDSYVSGSEEELLHFQYEWTNPRQDASAVLTVNALLALNGFCTAQSEGGLGDGGDAWLELSPSVDLLQTWAQPPAAVPPQASQSFPTARVEAASRGFLYSDDETSYAAVHRVSQVSYQQAVVPPGQHLIIDVALTLQYYVLDGKVQADFSSGACDVFSPFVHLAIVYV